LPGSIKKTTALPGVREFHSYTDVKKKNDCRLTHDQSSHDGKRSGVYDRLEYRAIAHDVHTKG